MPAATFHLLIADRLLEQWPAESRPFSFDETTRDAFRAGSIGPDMGYLGGYGQLPDLTHYVKATDLARAMKAASENDRDLAFAWGWVSHIISDVVVQGRLNGVMHHSIVPYIRAHENC